ncbi:hypothetical protein JJ691_30470 [Kutzneria sp. CA-103260]|nr:hypothetical protein JJ691_30470 [Kutzneria sp. CA-103260]
MGRLLLVAGHETANMIVYGVRELPAARKGSICFILITSASASAT